MLLQQNEFEYEFEFYKRSSNFRKKTNLTSLVNRLSPTVICQQTVTHCQLSTDCHPLSTVNRLSPTVICQQTVTHCQLSTDCHLLSSVNTLSPTVNCQQTVTHCHLSTDCHLLSASPRSQSLELLATDLASKRLT